MEEPMNLLPSYWLRRPAAALSPSQQAEFDAVLEAALLAGPAQPLDYPLEAPKWQFLCYAAEQRGLALHGSLNTGIDLFEPRQASDLRAFGAQQAVYAASDGIWPMFFAIVDRARHPTSIMNGCIRLETPGGELSEPYYFFSVGRHVYPLRPYTAGAVYLLPGEAFGSEPPMPFGEAKVHIAQLASLEPVAPLAKLLVEPEDFPFLAEMRAHDDDRLEEYAAALSTGAPWPE
jgi:hypothetical protein